MKIRLPGPDGRLVEHAMRATPLVARPLGNEPARRVLAAAHVVADPFADPGPDGPAGIDWEATLDFRCHLAGLGLGIAEAMDTAQRGMGLGWPEARELIGRTRAALPDARVFSGAGTDQLDPGDARSLDDVRRAYAEQTDAIQALGGRLIVMASRALARVARGPDDYVRLYGDVLGDCERPVILHWLGEMFDPALAGYWGAEGFEGAVETCLRVIDENRERVDGIKVSLLDEDKEIALRRRLPDGVRMYTGDDFNYPELIEGDEHGHSDALLGIFDPLAAHAAEAVGRLGDGDVEGFRATLDPTVALARLIFRAPTRHYKTGVVFLAWLNGFQRHFVMVGGAQSARPLSDLVEIFRLADACGALRDPELAVERMRRLLALHGL